MILTQNEKLYDRCMSYHDTAACWRPDRFAKERYEGELFCGSNFRMSELTGAVMVAQLQRLQSLLDRMRELQKRIADGIKDVPGVSVRPSHDRDGDTGICLMFYLNDEAKVADFVEALQAEGVAAGSVYNSSIPDWHIYAHWKHVIERKAPTSVQCPWTCPYHELPDAVEDVEYSEDMNPKTLAYLARIVHLDIPPQMTDEDADMIAAAIKKVAEFYA